MRDVLHLVYEYRRLLARQDKNTLGPRAFERLQALERLFGSEPARRERPDGKRQHARCDVNFPATIRARGGRVQPVNVVSMGGGGVRVTPAPALRPGDEAVIRIVGEDDRLYQYGVKVGWVQRDSESSAMGMPFVGVPREVSH
jgi:hypothetical protein